MKKDLSSADFSQRQDLSVLLREAVESVAIGFTIYDPQDRLVVCNEAYLSIYSTSRDLIVPGTTFEDIVRKGAQRGQYPQAIGNIDAWVKERVRQHQNPTGKPIEQELDGGRWLLIVEHKTPSGYLVGNRFDITASKRADHQVLRLYANIFERTREAILVTDQECRITAVNHAFTQLTGYELDEIRGQNPRLLSAGRTPVETYRSMWASINESDFWQGELWDRAKNGQVYPKWAVISAIRDVDGEVTNYISSFTDISERKLVEERVTHLAHHDPLTGLLNRLSLTERLEQALHSSYRDKQEVAVMFIDMDRFKLINDTLGHHVGDAMLVQVSRRLKETVRDSDIVARFGGDEFVVVLTGTESGLVAATNIAAKILQQLSAPYSFEGNQMHSSPSIGISIFPADGANAQDLLKNADAAMYHAKAQGRRNAQFFAATMREGGMERLHLENDLRVALAEQQFEVHYQPQYTAAGSTVCGIEALVRWRHPTYGLMTPDRFIPLAEETGLIEPLGTWVLEEACRQLAEWKVAGKHPLRMAVNLSARQLNSPGLAALVRKAKADYGIGPDELELEVTESVAMESPEQAIRQLQALRNLGVRLAIDDFGTGYSSLAYLKLLPIDTLKLDRAFVSAIETGEKDAAICRGIITMAHSLGLSVVAEGVETEGQRRVLVDCDCDFLQGYLFSKPLPAADMLLFLERLQKD